MRSIELNNINDNSLFQEFEAENSQLKIDLNTLRKAFLGLKIRFDVNESLIEVLSNSSLAKRISTLEEKIKEFGTDNRSNQNNISNTSVDSNNLVIFPTKMLKTEQEYINWWDGLTSDWKVVFAFVKPELQNGFNLNAVREIFELQRLVIPASLRGFALPTPTVGVWVKDISGVLELQNLTSLNLSNHEITTLSGISKLSNLQTLNVSGCNQLSDISELVKVEKLYRLTIYGVDSEVVRSQLNKLKSTSPNLIIETDFVF